MLWPRRLSQQTQLPVRCALQVIIVLKEQVTQHLAPRGNFHTRPVQRPLKHAESVRRGFSVPMRVLLTRLYHVGLAGFVQEMEKNHFSAKPAHTPPRTSLLVAQIAQQTRGQTLLELRALLAVVCALLAHRRTNLAHQIFLVAIGALLDDTQLASRNIANSVMKATIALEMGLSKSVLATHSTHCLAQKTGNFAWRARLDLGPTPRELDLQLPAAQRSRPFL